MQVHNVYIENSDKPFLRSSSSWCNRGRFLPVTGQVPFQLEGPASLLHVREVRQSSCSSRHQHDHGTLKGDETDIICSIS